MKKRKVSLIRRMQGIFIPCDLEHKELTHSIFCSLETLEYEGIRMDSIRMREDRTRLALDMHKSVKQAKIKFKVAHNG